jgi:hypothetical protein
VVVWSHRYVDESIAPKLLDSEALRALAYRAAAEGSVLLRNEPPPGAAAAHQGGSPPLLPLDPNKTKLSFAVVGPNGGCDPPDADLQDTMPMCDAQLNSASDRATHYAMFTWSLQPLCANLISPLLHTAIVSFVLIAMATRALWAVISVGHSCCVRSVLGNYAEVHGPPKGVSTVQSALLASGFAKSVTFSRGAEIDSKKGDPPGQRAAAVAQAREADVTIAVVGDSVRRHNPPVCGMFSRKK